MLILAFGHRKRRGKDLSAKLLCQNTVNKYGLESCKIRGFADPLYTVAHYLYSWAGFQERLYYVQHGEEKEKVLQPIGKSPRQILIDLGTKGIRDNVYDQTFAHHLVHNLPNVPIVFIPDVRFMNEVAILKSLPVFFDVKLIRIDRDIETQEDAVDNELSMFSDWDIIIDNNGTKKDLNLKLMENVFPHIEKKMERK